jgi:hypothetical protein
MTLYMTGASLDEVWPLVRDFHYSSRLPSAVQHVFAWRKPGGLFGDFGEPLAAIIYGIPVNRSWPSDALELQRLVKHPSLESPLSEFVAWSLRYLRANTNVPFVLSYADSGQGHHGGIYQATGFDFVRISKGDSAFLDGSGKHVHGRSMFHAYGTRSQAVILAKFPSWQVTRDTDKYVYVKTIRQRRNALMKRFGWTPQPFPKPDYAICPLDERTSSPCEPEASSGDRSNLSKRLDP